MEITNQLNPGVPFKDFSNPKTQLLTSDSRNALYIYCPQPTCRCLILRAKAGTWVERPKKKLNLPNETTETEPSDNIRSLQPCWRLTEMMEFENIGFSKTIGLSGIKYLSCADCDVGPLGYHETTVSDKEYLIAVDRVRYAIPSK
ncbi:hypothetical protein G9A89_019861 [Geosiphon pyriformis]|nr:hypothetical protein G9A89_019861 [Geosiphon pyriformis]